MKKLSIRRSRELEQLGIDKAVEYLSTSDSGFAIIKHNQHPCTKPLPEIFETLLLPALPCAYLGVLILPQTIRKTLN